MRRTGRGRKSFVFLSALAVSAVAVPSLAGPSAASVSRGAAAASPEGTPLDDPYVSEPFPAGSGSSPSSAPTPPADLSEGLGRGSDVEPSGSQEPDPVVDPGPAPGLDAPQQLTGPLFPPFNGQNTGFNPPDPVGDVGPNHYVQMVNANIQVWDKQGNTVLNSIPINQIWQENTTAGTGFDQCRQQNAGDPIVLYDQQVDRWMVSQFTTPRTATGPGGTFPMCIAYSRTGDPAGPNPGGATPTAGVWWVYQFNLPASHDYMKYGIWPDGLYMSTYEGGSLGAYAFDRAAMISGSPATFQYFSIGAGTGVDGRENRILPSDWDGANPPPPGAPNYFTMMLDGAFDGGNDRLEIREFHVDWTTPANSTFNLVTTLNTAAFDTDLGCTTWPTDGVNRQCIPQPGGGQLLDALANRLMHRLQYRNFGDHQAMVVNQTVDATTDNTNRAGVRWYELRDTGAGWGIHQQGTFAPNDGAHRWMGSAAMDGKGNIAIGYTVSDNNTVFPGLRYAARHSTDALGSMAQGEQTLITGAAAETSARWGDYSSMNVDPVDDCTFWYTGEHDNSQTSIGAFRLTSCSETDLSITKSDSPDPVYAGDQLNYALNVTNNGTNTANGVTVTDTLPAGVTFLSASPGCAHAAGVVTCDVGTLLAGQSVPLSIQVDIPADFLGSSESATITNTAIVAAANQSDSNPGNNTATAVTTVKALADLAVTKVCKPDDPAQAGEDGFCDIHVDNLGPSDARNVTLTDVLTSATPFAVLGATVSPSGTCNPSTSGPTTSFTTVCDLGTEPAAGRSTIHVTISSDDEAQVNDVATVESTTPDPDTSNNQATGRIDFVGSADLSLDKSAPASVTAGTQLTYTIAVHNDGPSTAKDVLVHDQLPLGVSFVSATPSQGTCTHGQPDERDLECALGNMAAGSDSTITVVGLVASGVPPGTVLFNEAVVSSATSDPDNDDVRDSVPTTVAASADLALTFTSDAPTTKPSSTIHYKVTVDNLGPSDASGVVATVKLPPLKSGYYLSDDGGCTLSNVTLTCPLATITAGSPTRTIFIDWFVQGSKFPVVASASVASPTPDPVAGNNSATVSIGKK